MGEMRSELLVAMRESGVGIGKIIRLIRAGKDLEFVARSVLLYDAELPEEVIVPAKAAGDVLDGGDGLVHK